MSVEGHYSDNHEEKFDSDHKRKDWIEKKSSEVNCSNNELDKDLLDYNYKTNKKLKV